MWAKTKLTSYCYKTVTIVAIFAAIVAFDAINAFATDTSTTVNFQQDVGVSFTFNSTLQVNVSADLYINNLAPGTSSDSNIITVNVITNNAAGYTLNATVGNSTYSNRYLNHATASGARFDSIDYGSSLASLTTPSTWGFSYLDESLNNGTNTTWTNYSGLPLYTDTTNIATLKTTTEPSASATGDNIKFKIAANADSNQISGTYNNVINFTAVAATIPVTLSDAFSNAGATKYNGYYKMQDMTSAICDATEVLDEGSQTQLIDTRDNKVYWATKLQDGNCWMTQNLDHDIVTTPNFYTYANTDIGHGSTPDTSATWTSDKATHQYVQGTIKGYWAGWQDMSKSPQSLDVGNLYWSGEPISSTDVSTWNSFLQTNYDECGMNWEEICTENSPTTFYKQGVSTGNTHYLFGNYYDFFAAVAMNYSEFNTKYSSYFGERFTVDQSICPAGWTLPSIDSTDYSDILSNYYTNLYVSPLFFTVTGFIETEMDAGSSGVGYVSSYFDKDAISDQHLDTHAIYDELEIENYEPGYIQSMSGYTTNGTPLRCIAR